MSGLVRRGMGSLVAVGVLLTSAACSPAATSSAGETAGETAGESAGESAGDSSAAGSTASESSSPGGYLALGDSVPFGYRGGEPADAYRDPTAFVGYPQLVAEHLGLDLLNASCPGETTGSFSDVTAQSNGCENSPGSDSGFRTVFPLHVDYASAEQSQLDYAVSALQQNEDIHLVTLQIGANDGFLCQATTPDQCSSEVGSVATTVQTNVDSILSTLRGKGGYDGTIVVVTYYALDYSDSQASETQQLNDGITRAAKDNDALVADGFAAFQPGAEKAGGSSIAAGLVRPNDVHPTEQGQQLLADAVTAVVPE